MSNQELIDILRDYQYGIKSGDIPPHSFDLNTETVEQIIAALIRDSVPSIPVVVMHRAIKGIDAADQCDQAGSYEFRLRNSLKEVLSWYQAPVYKLEISVCCRGGFLPKGGEPWAK